MFAPNADHKLFVVPFGTPNVIAGISRRVCDQPLAYSTRRPQGELAAANIRDIAATAGFSHESLVLPHKWPHGNRVIFIDDATEFARDERFGGLNPMLPKDGFGFANSCDGLITRRTDITLGVQNADCPMVFLHDPTLRPRMVGAIHCGWKPLARGVLLNAIGVMEDHGSSPENIRAYVGPGAGDEIYDFQDNDATHAIFAEFGREDLLDPAKGFYRRFERADQQRYRQINGEPKQPFGDHVLALSAIARQDLISTGVYQGNIRVDRRSCVLDPSLHSYRRDGSLDPTNSDHGLSLGFIKAS